MIDIYATKGTFAEPQAVAQAAAKLMMKIEGVPEIPMFLNNTAGFVHELPANSFANANGDDHYVRVQVLTNAGALNRDQQLALTEQMTDLIAEAAHDEALRKQTWVLLTEAEAGGWGLWGHAHTNDELVQAARDEIGRLQGN
ncbi:hypothetical protein IV55_GL001731 [Furfurilactobacillus siliginis]|nr:hypothetical protein IV55_GL001731 [Furfurilactobacillus siliginis]